MCGIVGYVGSREAWPIVVNGLKRLEYRGYDSAGVGLVDKFGELRALKKQGKVSDLEAFVRNEDLQSTLAIGHTRWATHGAPSDINSHPHQSGDGNLLLVHNGIIENYASLKEELSDCGHEFISETDSEVLVHLIQEVQQRHNCSSFEAVRLALSQVVGAYAILVIDKQNPDEIIAARKGSPMVIGVGNGEYFIASDASPIVEYTKNVVYLNDFELARISPEALHIRSIEDHVLDPVIQELELKLEAIERGGYEFFMLKEIHEQPRSIFDSMRGRIDAEKGCVQLGGLAGFTEAIRTAKRMIVLGCGTSWHAGLVGEYLIESFAKLPVEVEYASEFRYREPIIYEDDLVLAISQSGETADTLAAIELAKEHGATVFGICNVVGSSIARIVDAGIYTHAGPEIGVASTKAFTAQVTAVTLMAFHIASLRKELSPAQLRPLLQEMEKLPDLVQRCLAAEPLIQRLSEEIKDSANCLFLGRGTGFPVALEGALKLKEISYIHAEGYPAAEMKHGPIALIDHKMPVIVIATKNPSYEKVLSNIQEVKARQGKVIAIVTEGDNLVAKIADFVLEIPVANDAFVPILASVPLQLLAYYVAILRGCDVDRPRNLAKSVTVE